MDEAALLRFLLRGFRRFTAAVFSNYTPMSYWRLPAAKTVELLPSQLKVIDFEPA